MAVISSWTRSGLREQLSRADSSRTRHLSAASEEAQLPRHQTQLPVVTLQASGVGSSAQGSAGTDRVRSRPSVTPLKPPDR